MRPLSILALCIGAIAPISATTLQQLSLSEMAERSTSIVRAKVLGAEAMLRGGDVYTIYRLETLENLKVPRQKPAVQELAVPGGVAGGIRQVVAGAPALRVGGEYVLFLWTSRSGLTQIMGLSQGLFSVRPGASGPVGALRPAGALRSDALATRVSAGEHMLDSSGQPVHDAAVTLRWTELKTQVRRALETRPLTAGTAAGSK